MPCCFALYAHPVAALPTPLLGLPCCKTWLNFDQTGTCNVGTVEAVFWQDQRRGSQLCNLLNSLQAINQSVGVLE